MAYTRTQAQFREGALAGRTVPLVPSYQLALGASWKPLAELTLSATTRKVASAVMENGEVNALAARIPGHTLVDLRAAWDTRNWQFAVAVNNLFDRNYFNYAITSTTSTNFNAYPLPGRTALATVAYRFQ
jgi:iron complex outermembrane receptor protein